MISVVYACNNAYVRQTLVSVVSVWKYNPDAKVYLIEDEISKENRELIAHIVKTYGMEVSLYELKEMLPELNLDDKDRHPHTIYSKLFLDQIIKEDRVLYLDSDVIIQGPLEELFSRDMTGEIAAGVLMPYSEKLKDRMKIEVGNPYICDGVVLINLERWRNERKGKQCIQYIRECHGNPPMLSEGTLNYICQGAVGVLAPKYNLMPSMLMYELGELKKLFRADCYYNEAEEMKEARQEPIIIHYMNELYNRPWFEPSDHPFKECYRELEREVFGDNEIAEVPLAKHTRMTVWLRKLLPFELFAALYHLKNQV